MTIGDIFSEGDRAKLEALIDEEKEPLAHDLNLGLAKQLLKRLTQKNIENLSAIFVQLSLKEIQQKAILNPEENVESVLCEMVISGQTQAKVSKSNMTVEFMDSEEAEALQLICTIEQQNARIVELAEKQNKVSRDLKLSKKYLLNVLDDKSPEQIPGDMQ